MWDEKLQGHQPGLRHCPYMNKKSPNEMNKTVYINIMNNDY